MVKLKDKLEKFRYHIISTRPIRIQSLGFVPVILIKSHLYNFYGILNAL